MIDLNRFSDAGWRNAEQRRYPMINFMLVRHTVKEFAGWKKGYDEDLPTRNEAGLTEKFLLRGVDKPNEVIVLFEVKDIAKAKKFAESAELRDAMTRAGVIDKPDVYFLSEEKAGAYAKASGF
jgi:hypothetical protein